MPIPTAKSTTGSSIKSRKLLGICLCAAIPSAVFVKYRMRNAALMRESDISS